MFIVTGLWPTDWPLTESKREFMLIGLWQRLCTFENSPNLVLDDFPIKQVANTKSLGVLVNKYLTWNAHIILNISKEIASGIGVLKRCRPFIPIETLRYAFSAIFSPILITVYIVWGNCNNILVINFQKLQNRAAGILTFFNYDADAEPLLERLGWKRLADRRKFHMATMAYKSLNDLAPEYLKAKFVNRSSTLPIVYWETEQTNSLFQNPA